MNNNDPSLDPHLDEDEADLDSRDLKDSLSNGIIFGWERTSSNSDHNNLAIFYENRRGQDPHAED